MIRLIGVFLIGLITASFFSFDSVQEVRSLFSKPCTEPLSYKIGSVDPLFGIDAVKLRSALSDAEKLWEADGSDLLTYSDTGSVVINFVYDERQERTAAERKLRGVIGAKHTEVTSTQQSHAELTLEYETALAEYESRRKSYEKELAAYNATIAEWNEKGGAPASVYDELNVTRAKLEKEADRLRSLSESLNEAVALLNDVGEKANVAASEYNEVAGQYNEHFHDDRAFTQGDYQQRTINIYQYGSAEELRLVLAHELGHALGLGHVTGDASIMNEVTSAQVFAQGLSAEDRAQLAKVCRFEE